MDECYRTKNQKHEIHYNRVKIMNFMFLDSVSVAKLKISSTQLNNFEKNIHLYICTFLECHHMDAQPKCETDLIFQNELKRHLSSFWYSFSFTHTNCIEFDRLYRIQATLQDFLAKCYTREYHLNQCSPSFGL